MGTMKKEAFKEAVTDTALAAAINMPLNYALIAFAFSIELTALQSTLMFTSVFTVIAITRKYYIRMHFERRKLRGC
jgi:hypothetical protein